jgi:FkbM family methyltransferase
MNDTLFRKVQKLDFKPRHVAEVGVYLPETSNILGFIEAGCRADLVEPDPQSLEKIVERFSGYPNVTVHPVAIFNERRTLQLYRTNASTFVKGLPASPALVNDRYQPVESDLFAAEALPFSDIDDGTIDLLSIDTEGCEWYVISTMASRPAIISLETHGKRYTNPFRAEIDNWMKEKGYRRWYSDTSDTVFIGGGIRPGFLSRWF